MDGLSYHNLEPRTYFDNINTTPPTLELLHMGPNEFPREKILEAFSLEPFLTIAQVAKLFYAVRRDGQPAKSTKFRPRKTTEYELVPGYHSARAILNRM